MVQTLTVQTAMAQTLTVPTATAQNAMVQNDLVQSVAILSDSVPNAIRNVTADFHCRDETVWPAVHSAVAVVHSAGAAVHSFAAVVRYVEVLQHVGVAHYAEVSQLVVEVHSVVVVVDR